MKYKTLNLSLILFSIYALSFFFCPTSSWATDSPDLIMEEESSDLLTMQVIPSEKSKLVIKFSSYLEDEKKNAHHGLLANLLCFCCLPLMEYQERRHYDEWIEIFRSADTFVQDRKNKPSEKNTQARDVIRRLHTKLKKEQKLPLSLDLDTFANELAEFENKAGQYLSSTAFDVDTCCFNTLRWPDPSEVRYRDQFDFGQYFYPNGESQIQKLLGALESEFN